MPSISRKGQDMPASPIRRLAPHADAAKKRGVHIYHLNIGQPDIETPKQFWDIVHHLQRRVVEYSPSNGYEDLRKGFAKYYRERCDIPDIQSDDILITTGASEALMFTLFSILDPEDEIIIPEPLYANYIGFARSGGINVRPIPTYFDDAFALPSIDAFEKVINPNTKAILLCNPNNPTGYAYTDEELERLKGIVKKHDLFLISDEVYRNFLYTGRPHCSLFNATEIAQQVIMVDSVSKAFSACGARIGLVASKNHEVLQTVLKFAQQRLSPPTVEQLGVMGFFEVEEDYFRNVNAEYRHRRDTIVNALNTIDGVQCHSPGGAFYCIARLPVEDTDDFCQWMLSEFSYEGSTVMMAPASGFYSTPGMGKDEVRVAYVLNPDDLKKAVACLAEGLKAYKKNKE